MFKIRSLLIRWNKRKILTTIGNIWVCPWLRCSRSLTWACPSRGSPCTFLSALHVEVITCHGPAHSRAEEIGVTTGLVSRLITRVWIQALISVCPCCGCGGECIIHFITSSRPQVTQPVIPSQQGYSTIKRKAPVRQAPIYALVRIFYFTCNHGR